MKFWLKLDYNWSTKETILNKMLLLSSVFDLYFSVVLSCGIWNEVEVRKEIVRTVNLENLNIELYNYLTRVEKLPNYSNNNNKVGVSRNLPFLVNRDFLLSPRLGRCARLTYDASSTRAVQWSKWFLEYKIGRLCTFRPPLCTVWLGARTDFCCDR